MRVLIDGWTVSLCMFSCSLSVMIMMITMIMAGRAEEPELFPSCPGIGGLRDRAPGQVSATDYATYYGEGFAVVFFCLPIFSLCVCILLG